MKVLIKILCENEQEYIEFLRKQRIENKIDPSGNGGTVVAHPDIIELPKQPEPKVSPEKVIVIEKPVCPECKKEFYPTTRNQKFCNKKCYIKDYLRRYNAKEPVKKPEIKRDFQ